MTMHDTDIWGRAWSPCANCPHPTPGACRSRSHRAFCAHLARDPETWGPLIAAEPPEHRTRRGAPAPAVPPSHPGRTLDAWAYVTEADLVRDTLSLLPRVPAGVDLVVGIARSGLLPASLVAYHRHLKLLTCSRQRGLHDPGSGIRLEGSVPGEYRPPEAPRHVLIVDDTAAHGGEMRANLEIVRAAFPDAQVTRTVVYCHPRALSAIDLCHAVYPGAHYLSWNWPNAGHGAGCGWDCDGLLCRDFTPHECRDEASYRAAMAAIEPRFLPRRLPVPLIVTARPESCRGLTEAWLRRHGVRWERLIMWPGDFHPPAAEVAPWKARHYAESDCYLFAESDPWQAERINALTGRPVLCPDAGKVFPPREPEAPEIRPASEPEPAPKPARRAPTPGLALQIRAARAARECPHRSRVGCGCGKVSCTRDDPAGVVLPHSDCVACAAATLEAIAP